MRARLSKRCAAGIIAMEILRGNGTLYMLITLVPRGGN